jgi:hypothetical protein
LNYIQSFQLEFCVVGLRADGIIENRFVRDQPYEIDVKHLKEIAEAMQVLSKGKRMPLLSIAGLYGSITTEARKASINPSDQYTLALALVIKELPQRLLANFYFKVKKVDYPVKSFSTEEEASAWLLQQMRQQQMVG